MSSRQHRRLFSTGTLKGTGRFPRPAGVLCPHFIVFANSWDEADADENHDDDDDDDAAFELHVTRTRDFKPEEVGTPVMARETRRAIEEYLGYGGNAPNWDDMFVQIKCPLLTPERIAEAAARGETCATTDCYESMALSRGASSLGAMVAVESALGRYSAPDDARVDNAVYAKTCEDYSVFSDHVSSSAGVELMHCEILMMLTRRREPSSKTPRSKFRMARGRMDDAIDLAGVTRCVESARGSRGTNTIVTAIVKADPAASVRGRRTTMLSDSDIHATRHARAAVGGVVAAAVGDCRVYVSGGAEHQGPDGGGPVCVISRVGGARG